MNERIKELEKLATPRCYDETGCYIGNRFDPEKFAELIVAECLAIAKNREDELESAGFLEESSAVGNVAYRISRQFGVKR
jgi:hypothetical protein